MFRVFKIAWTFTDSSWEDEDHNVLFLKNYEVYLKVLWIKWVEILALGFRCGSNIVDILLHFG